MLEVPMWVLCLFACVQGDVPPREPPCEDSRWQWSEVIVRDPCWGDEGLGWDEPAAALECTGENGFTWSVADIAFACEHRNAAFSCTHADGFARGRFVERASASGMWTHVADGCEVETRFEAVRLP